MATAKMKAIKVPGTKAPKLGMKLPTAPKAPSMGTTTQNLKGYATASKMPQMPKPSKFTSASRGNL